MNEPARERGPEEPEETGVATRRFVDATVGDAAGRVGAYVQSRLDRVSDRAQDLARDAGARVERLTGRPVESWTRDVPRLVREYPVQAILVAMALGYVLGKLVLRPERTTR